MSMYSSSSVSSTPSSTSSSAPASAASEDLLVGKSKETVSNGSGGGGVHPHHHHAMDDEEMEEIRSLGEQHQMEWSDTINLVTSARWSNFLKTMEIEAEEGDEYDQVMEFPDWLMNANESSCLQQHFDDHFSDAYLQDPALPCMDIGEIEGMDGEWLA
ncbi:hypothetical protein OSB04_014596 [Centaurea solstitialis]|uniref:Uncharacterized protein n=1 Tax=Centaurea solstitialis TaxID=347529 RepID=A0AA38WJB5_9ASTR|nr:hypothetical protein OSB04_014596 [Centaurea solstitialis]